ncbi:PREDICTED: homeobox protein Hox-B9-like, partial [Sturnus vulgaris]|uniref:homeobox protein Hox-B9-like n=1 Tax=Sturnus vulgaris TaxID=9172 RepID=UPI000719FFEB
MSISGTLTNYFVDSIINHESQESSASKFAPAQFPPAGRAAAEHLEFPSCSFQPKSAFFGAPWGSPAGFQPYLGAHGGVPGEGRFLRAWLEGESAAEEKSAELGDGGRSAEFRLESSGRAERREEK